MEVYIWFILMVVFLVVEAACPFHLVSIWFAIGALAAGIVALLSGGLAWQIGVFLLVSCGLLVLLLPFVKKLIQPKIQSTNVDSVIGTQGYVTETIDNVAATGQVKLGGMFWTARSASGETISAGTLVQVKKIEGVKVYVHPVKEQVTC